MDANWSSSANSLSVFPALPNIICCDRQPFVCSHQFFSKNRSNTGLFSKKTRPTSQSKTVLQLAMYADTSTWRTNINEGGVTRRVIVGAVLIVACCIALYFAVFVEPSSPIYMLSKTVDSVVLTAATAAQQVISICCVYYRFVFFYSITYVFVFVLHMYTFLSLRVILLLTRFAG
jgi:hypothetical protein